MTLESFILSINAKPCDSKKTRLKQVMEKASLSASDIPVHFRDSISGLAGKNLEAKYNGWQNAFGVFSVHAAKVPFDEAYKATVEKIISTGSTNENRQPGFGDIAVICFCVAEIIHRDQYAGALATGKSQISTLTKSLWDYVTDGKSLVLAGKEIPKPGVAPDNSPSVLEKIVWTPSSIIRNDYEPSTLEYLADVVHKPGILQDVLTSLQHGGHAVVLGRGAAGKTVLAKLVALHRHRDQHPAYMADLARGGNETANKIVSDVGVLQNQKALVIVDNAHLAPGDADFIFRSWQALPKEVRPSLLLLGRETVSSEASLVATHTLVAGQRDALGLCKRILKTEPPAERREEILEWWEKEFGSKRTAEPGIDLMALTAALTTLKDKPNHDWTLSVSDAKEAVRKKYLAPLIKDHELELENVRLLSALPDDYQIVTSALPQPGIAFDHTVNTGLVFVHLNKTSKEQYAFTHGALARLFWVADDRRMQHIDAAQAIAKVDPNCAIALLERNLNPENMKSVRKVFENVIADTSWLGNYGGTLGSLKQAIEWSIRQGFIDWQKWDNMLSERPRELFRVSLRHPISFFSSFLEFCDKQEDRTATWVSLVNQASNHIDEVATFLSLSPLGHAAHFIDYVSKRAKAPVYIPIVELLNNDACLSSLAIAAPNAQLDDLARLLDSPPLDSTLIPESIMKIIDCTKWNEVHESRRYSQNAVNAAVNFARLVRKYKRKDLGIVPARKVFGALLAGDVKLGQFNINQLGNMLGLAEYENEESAEQFRLVVTDDWLNTQYSKANPKTVVGNLHTFCSKGGRRHWSWAMSDVLSERLFMFFSSNTDTTQEVWLEHLGMLGCFADCGGDLSKLKSISWPTDDQIRDAVERRSRAANSHGISILEKQTWLGAAFLPLVTERRIAIDGMLGDLVLKRFQHQLAMSDQEGLTTRMMPWLLASEDNSWVLATADKILM